MAQLPETKHSIIELNESWLTFWFNRPEKRNALSNDLIEDIQNTLLAIKDDRSIRGIIFRGKGGIFCAGADLDGLKKISSGGDESHQISLQMSKKFGEIFKMISKTPQFTVAVVEGAAMAGAFGIACASDLLVSMSDAKYALTETKIGLTPAQITPYVLNRLGFANARKMLLLGNIINGQEAYEMGMVDYLVNNESEINDIILKIKNQVQKCAPNAIAITKEILSNNNLVNPENAAELFSSSIISEEGQEGLASFFEKRKPFWAREE